MQKAEYSVLEMKEGTERSGLKNRAPLQLPFQSCSASDHLKRLEEVSFAAALLKVSSLVSTPLVSQGSKKQV